MSRTPVELERKVWDAERLMKDHPPRIRDANKRLILEALDLAQKPCRGLVEYSRWKAVNPADFHLEASLAEKQTKAVHGFYDYRDSASGLEVWHVNFADPNLFVAYGGSLFAQDEMQATEHPVLGSIREALIAESLPTKTRESQEPTPVLIRGAERRCAVATDQNDAEGRPQGLYGNQFSRAPSGSILKALQILPPGKKTNLIALAAPSGGQGRYVEEDIGYALVTAVTVFRAAALYSRDHGGREVEIRSGLWGCGAFGGCPELMLLVQMIAAAATEAQGFTIHLPGGESHPALAAARNTLARLPSGTTLDKVPALLAERGYLWGRSDGN